MKDVIIVGGGHVGLYTAWKLAGEGFDVHLFDQKKAIGESVVCTGIIGSEAFRKFDLPEETILGSIQNVRFNSPFGSTLNYEPPQILAWLVDRARFNRYFEKHAVSKGAQITTGTRVKRITVKKEGVTVRAVDLDGKETHHHAKALILATGVNYKLFEWLKLQPPTTFLGGAHVEMSSYADDDVTSIYVGRDVAPGSFAWSAPMDNGKIRLGLLSEKYPAHYIRKFLNEVRPGWRDDISESSIELRPVVHGPVEKSYADRVLVVGEAAGQIKTTTGGGIYYGLLGAQIAVETLQQAFRKNKFTANVLSPYERKWKKAIGDEIRFGIYFRKLFTKLTDEQTEDLFDRVSQEHLLNLAHREAKFDWHKSLIFSVFKIPTVRRVFQEPF